MALTGQLPASLLVTVQGSLRLTAATAAAWRGVADEVARRYGWRPVLNSAYRDYASQVGIFTARYRRQQTGAGPYGDVKTWNGRRYVRYSALGAAAIPGTSNHGRGNTVDVADLGGFASTRFAQFATVAARWGWSNAEGRKIGEFWHWVHVSNVTPTPTATTPTDQEDDMLTYQDIMNALAECLMKSTQAATAIRRIVWADTKVGRDGRQISALQELADAKSAALRAEAKSDAILTAVKTIPGVDTAALARTVAAAVADANAGAVVDELVDRLRD